MKRRTSATHPLQITSLDIPAGGRIGMTFCPGKRDLNAMTGAWDRVLLADLRTIAGWGATALVTLMEAHELEQLGVPDLGDMTGAMGLTWYHLPIRDVSIPGRAFEVSWRTVGAALRQNLSDGKRIVIHCRGGLGRTGVIAARLLIEMGETPDTALARVRAARPGAVETAEQQEFVLRRVPELVSLATDSEGRQ